MGTNDNSSFCKRCQVFFFNYLYSFGSKISNHFFVMDDRPQCINRMSAFFNQLINFIYCTFYTKAESGGFGNFNFHEKLLLLFWL